MYNCASTLYVHMLCALRQAQAMPFAAMLEMSSMTSDCLDIDIRSNFESFEQEDPSQTQGFSVIIDREE